MDFSGARIPPCVLTVILSFLFAGYSLFPFLFTFVLLREKKLLHKRLLSCCSLPLPSVRLSSPGGILLGLQLWLTHMVESTSKAQCFPIRQAPTRQKVAFTLQITHGVSCKYDKHYQWVWTGKHSDITKMTLKRAACFIFISISQLPDWWRGRIKFWFIWLQFYHKRSYLLSKVTHKGVWCITFPRKYLLLRRPWMLYLAFPF